MTKFCYFRTYCKDTGLKFNVEKLAESAGFQVTRTEETCRTNGFDIEYVTRVFYTTNVFKEMENKLKNSTSVDEMKEILREFEHKKQELDIKQPVLKYDINSVKKRIEKDAYFLYLITGKTDEKANYYNAEATLLFKLEELHRLM